MRRLPTLPLLLLAALLALALVSPVSGIHGMRRGRNRPAAGASRARFTAASSKPTPTRVQAASARYPIVAELEDGPTMMETRARAQAALESMAKQHANWASTQQHTNEATSESDRAALESAAKAAHEYAMSFVQRAHATQEAGEAEARQPPSAHDASAYDLLAQRQMEQQQHGKQKARKSTGAEHSQRENANYRFAQTGVFLEEGIKMQTGSFPKQEWTYSSDSAAPPPWAAPVAGAAQGCPTTKPPPVPRMPPPPPPTPTPTWMSPFDEHNEPVFPHSDTPAPTYGMGPVPPGPPANYLPLDAFISPGPSKGA